MKLMLITNQADIAEYVVARGADTIFLDCEKMGKVERQGHLDTLISNHDFNDIPALREAIGNKELLVRINPLYPQTAEEIEQAIEGGADIIMLPMFHDADSVAEVAALIRGRCKFIPLVETRGAMQVIQAIALIKGVSEIYIGLNDLHLDCGLDFIFEPMINGMLASMVSTCKQANMPFGFGGVARVGEGQVRAENILQEHIRLGSSRVILSRTFHRRASSVIEIKAQMNFEQEVAKIRQVLDNAHKLSVAALAENFNTLQEQIAYVQAMV